MRDGIFRSNFYILSVANSFADLHLQRVGVELTTFLFFLRNFVQYKEVFFSELYC